MGLLSLQGQVLWRQDAATPGSRTGMSWCRFSHDGRTIFGLARDRDGRRGLWALPVSGGAARLAITPDDPALDLFYGPPTVGPDRLYLTVSEHESDIWVAKLRY